jgi:HlyD family secretion protein
MPVRWLKRASGGALIAVALAGVAVFAWPRPIPVDLATVTRTPMEVTVDEEARTRVRHIYTVSAPVSGRVLRISQPPGSAPATLHVGDEVAAHQTVVAVMQPTLPSFLDARSRDELKAALAAADAAIKLAEAEARRVEVALDLSRSELDRTQALALTNVASAKALEKAKADVDANEAALASARAQRDVRISERASLAAKLIEPSQNMPRDAADCCISIRSPVSGRVLRIIQESESVVQAGTPLIDIGDPADLEVVADLLSSDAVRVQPGAPVRIDGWGGAPVSGRVSRIDPAGFLKVSALGIEEQRVRTIVEFTDPPDKWARLGHDFRVIVHVAIWRGENVLTVPVGALFRSGSEWAVFAEAGGRARMKEVKTGNRNTRQVEIVSGLSAGDRVVLHASDRVQEGVRVSERNAGG